MALQKVGSKVVAKISDLSQEATLTDGDRIVFWCHSTGEAATIDYSNIKIDQDHTTFGDTFNEIVNFATTANAWVDSMNESFEELNTKMDEVINSNNSVSNDILALKMLVKMILGLATDHEGNFTEEQYINALPEDAHQIYESLKQEVLTAAGVDNFDFTHCNLLYLASQ